MGKFINTKRNDTINSLIDGFKDRLNNPYYIHLDKPVTIVDFYNVDIEASTLDEGLKIIEAEYGENSPLRYNLIEGFYLYGLEKIQLQLEEGDFGLQSSGLEGEAIVLPNTIIPYPNSNFAISHFNKTYLFKVTETTVDTLENGANFYKIQFEYERDTDTVVFDQITRRYKFVSNNVGTQFNTIILENDYNFIERVEEITVQLKKYYKYLFFNSRVETFIYNYKDNNFYDPNVIEFIMRNGLMEGDGEFIYIAQQLTLPYTFILDYDKSIFRSLELSNMKTFSDRLYAIGEIVRQPLSSLSYRKETYYSLKHVTENALTPIEKINIFNNLNANMIKKGFINPVPMLENIFSKYFTNHAINSEDIAILNEMEYTPVPELFYYMPIIIFILESHIKRVLMNDEPKEHTYEESNIGLPSNLKLFSDELYVYFATLDHSGWKVYRYNSNNLLDIQPSGTEPMTIEDCQALYV